MRWERLFADLEARLEAEERAVVAGDVIDLVRAERVRLTARDRLQAHVGTTLSWSLGSGETAVEGELLDLGTDWVLVRISRADVLVPLAAVQHIGGLSRLAEPPRSEIARRLGLGLILRGLSRDRAVVSVQLAGDQHLTGTIDRVGADHLDLAVHAPDEPRRNRAVQGVRCVFFHAITTVRVH